MKKIMFNDKYGLTQAVLEGRKTQTRRIIKDKKLDFAISHFGIDNISFIEEQSIADGSLVWGIKTKNIPGYINCISSTYNLGEIVAIAQRYKDIVEKRDEAQEVLDLYKIGEKYLTIEEMGAGWSNKMFVAADLMPHHIRITNVRVERLQDISDEDCLREGVVVSEGRISKKYYPCQHLKDCACIARWGIVYDTPREAYAALIDKISGKGVFQYNPFVFAYEFELID